MDSHNLAGAGSQVLVVQLSEEMLRVVTVAPELLHSHSAASPTAVPLTSPMAGTPKGAPLASVAFSGSNPGSMQLPSHSNASGSIAGTPLSAAFKREVPRWRLEGADHDAPGRRQTSLNDTPEGLVIRDMHSLGVSPSALPAHAGGGTSNQGKDAESFSVEIVGLPAAMITEDKRATVLEAARGGQLVRGQDAPSSTLPVWNSAYGTIDISANRSDISNQFSRSQSGTDGQIDGYATNSHAGAATYRGHSEHAGAPHRGVALPQHGAEQQSGIRFGLTSDDDWGQYGRVVHLPSSPLSSRQRRSGSDASRQQTPPSPTTGQDAQQLSFADSMVIHCSSTEKIHNESSLWNGPVVMKPITPSTSVLIPPAAQGSTSESEGDSQTGNMDAYVLAAQARIRAQMSRAQSSDTIRTDTTPMLGTPGMPDIAMAQAHMAAGRHQPREPEGFRLRISPLQRRLESPPSNVPKPGDQMPSFSQAALPRPAAGQKATLPRSAYEL